MAGQSLEPPLIQNTADAAGRTTQAWSEWYQAVSDRLSKLGTMNIGMGVTDGSEATAGQVGEYLTASGSVALADGSPAAVASLTLSAGDWDVIGHVVFNLAATDSNQYQYAAAIDGVGTQIIATITASSGVYWLPAGPVRRNVTASTVVQLVAVAGFTAGTVSVDGTISARRAR